LRATSLRAAVQDGNGFLLHEEQPPPIPIKRLDV
jgi:hypothetical protein